MENVKFRALSMCILIFVVVCNFLFSDGIRWTKYNVESGFNGYRCIPSLTVFETNTADASACGKLCHSDSMCSSFIYQQDDLKCIGCMVDLFGQRLSNPVVQLPGSTYYRSHRVDCKDILENNRAAASGIYEIKPWKSKSKIKVLCDMETNGGGWTVFHNRFNGTVDFYRNFTDYENGFGDTAGEFWLGFKYIEEMAKTGRSELMLQVTAKNGSTGHEIADGFTMIHGNEYSVYFEEHFYNHEKHGLPYEHECLPKIANEPFTTMDRDMFEFEDNCAEEMHSAWWYLNCVYVICDLHGKYGKNGPAGYYHRGITGLEPLKASRMMFRRK
ncbi:microfibril-associated glycoprotein 4-like [Mercenaria mercenaria]|uniref:microfibril-associated glycoprotein 4-like n=1 Tax=Mercenaria mercenaria TaxID=6596 RepID=UPI00234F1F25|nr:microfibril-associated glycoprotein 4-like [Mercenaria mercenaria]